ncbi:MAG: ABC-F family ATP-binding cassette domain-containing protein [bacterium]
MIKVSNLCKSYGNQTLFQDVTFNINPKERIGLVGRNGHGKTTLFRLILKLEEPDSGVIVCPKNYRLGYLEQHLNFTQRTILEEVCLGLPKEQEHDSWRAKKIMAGLGFEQTDYPRAPAEFSGGFQVRLNLAKLLVSDPDILLLDEPTNYLDIVAIRWLTQFLRSWTKELMLITHDRKFMDQVTTHTLGIHRKRIRKIAGDTQKLYDQILADEEIYEKTRLNDEKKRKEVEQFIRRFRAKARLANMVQSRIKTLQKKEKKEKLQPLESLDFSFKSAEFPAKTMMRVEDISFKFGENQATLFEGLSFEVGKRDRICVMGKNGKGKTTLLKVVAGVLPPNTGQIKMHPALKTGYFEQTNTSYLDPHRTVEEEIRFSNTECTHQTARDIAGAMMFSGDLALKKISVLSGGEKSRVMLGKILAAPSHLLLLDEPTNHLDMESCDSLLAALDSFEGSVILVTHNEMFLHTLANRLIVFDRGKQFVYEGSYQDFLNDVGWQVDEEREAVETKEQSSQSTRDEVLDKKALRKRKAEIVQQKSKVLNPLKSQIEKMELEIEELELQMVENNQQLIYASTNGNGQEFAALVKKERALKSEIDTKYETLDRITVEYEEQLRSYEKLLEQF